MSSDWAPKPEPLLKCRCGAENIPGKPADIEWDVKGRRACCNVCGNVWRWPTKKVSN